MKYHLYLAALPWLAVLPFQQKPTLMQLSGCEVRLVTRMEGDQLTVVGHCRNSSAQPVSLRYELQTEKRGTSGTSNNSQSGNVTVAAQQDVALSQTSINISPSDFYRIRLRMLDAQGSLVAEDSLVHNVGSRPN